MKLEKTRLLVIGAGVNGSICSTNLYHKGFDVTVLARGTRYDDIRNEGIIIEDPLTRKRTITHVPVINVLDPKDTYEYILVIVRRNQVTPLLPTLSRNASPNIVFMGNNLTGADEYISALGTDRVMMGFVFGGGKRDGNIIRAFAPRGLVSTLLATPFGEINGAITPRLLRLVHLFRQAGLNATTSTNISDYLVTHAVGVALIAGPLMKHNCHTYELARSQTDLRLIADGYRESRTLLRTLGHKIIPPSQSFVLSMPRFILVPAFRTLFGSKIGEIGAGWHCSQAPDEMRRLIDDLQTLVEQSGLPVPAMRELVRIGENVELAALPV